LGSGGEGWGGVGGWGWGVVGAGLEGPIAGGELTNPHPPTPEAQTQSQNPTQAPCHPTAPLTMHDPFAVQVQHRGRHIVRECEQNGGRQEAAGGAQEAAVQRLAQRALGGLAVGGGGGGEGGV